MSKQPQFKQLGLIGCGLMGGSFALAMKQAGAVKRVVGYSKSPSTTERAKQLGVIDDAAPSALMAVSGADLVLLAVPVGATEATLKSIRQLVTPDMLILDVGSTKHDVVQAAERALGGARMTSFVPSHPIAGKEKSGIEFADPKLYQTAQVILTPTAHNTPDYVTRAEQVWRAVGCETVRQMDASLHDAAFASVSHLPHLIAFALMLSISHQPEAEQLLSLAGASFRDVTRIAASDPTMWRDIFIANRDELLNQSHQFRIALDDFENLLQPGSETALQAKIREASEARKNWRMTGV